MPSGRQISTSATSANTTACASPASTLRQQDQDRHFSYAEKEATEHRARQTSETADDTGDKGHQHGVETHMRLHAAAPRHDEDAGQPGEQSGNRECARNDPVGANPTQPNHFEIQGCGAHGHAQSGSAQEECQRQYGEDGGDGFVDLQRRDPDRSDRQRPVEKDELRCRHGAR